MHSETFDYETQIQRNKGIRSISGKLVKGTLNQAPVKLRVSSIPSKYENVIYNVNSRPAFGDSTEKFYIPQSVTENNTPGPGCYELNKSYSKIDSKKGSGFFASATKLHRLERALSHGPGPGSYRSSSEKSIFWRKKYNKNDSTLNSSKSTAILSSQMQDRNLFKKEIQESLKKPAIGSYNISPQKYEKYKKAYAAFKSKVDRFTAQTQKAPPVGLYQLSQTTASLNISQRTKKYEIQKINQQNSAEKQKLIENSIKSLYKKEERDKLGPGSYETSLQSTARVFKIRQTMYDRFGQLKPIYQMAKNIEAQSEQTYNNQQVQKKTHKKFDFMFKSPTQRSDIIFKNQMDPGRYNPRVESPQKSHHVNFLQKWI